MKDAKEENNTTQQAESEYHYENYEEYLKSTEIRDDIEEECEWER
ncbi:hypothetical protein ACKX2L_06090 [Lachnospiraceae bacterium YH-ros2228]